MIIIIIGFSLFILIIFAKYYKRNSASERHSLGDCSPHNSKEATEPPPAATKYSIREGFTSTVTDSFGNINITCQNNSSSSGGGSSGGGSSGGGSSGGGSSGNSPSGFEPGHQLDHGGLTPFSGGCS